MSSRRASSVSSSDAPTSPRPRGRPRKTPEPEHTHASGVSPARTVTATAPVADGKPASSPFWDKWRARTESSVVMIALFALLLYLGHYALLGLVMFLQVWIFVELRDLRDKTIFRKLKETRKKKFAPFVLDWTFFVATNYYVYGKIFLARFENFVFSGQSDLLQYMLSHHSFFSFLLYIFAFVMFVVSLEDQMYKWQFLQLAWTFVILQMTSFHSSFYLNTIFDGMIWFFLPASLVIANDILAFVFGYFFGRTPLIQLSPKKTWEGFLGAFPSTLLIGLLFASWLSQYEWMTCPKGPELFSWRVHCVPDATFQWHTFTFPAALHSLLSIVGLGHWHHVHYMPIQLHALVTGTFASLIAPFGGFFASGFKRAVKIKDFGETIPGHGGITDRMDCQMLMGMFMYVYYTNFIRAGRDVSYILQSIYSLTSADQLSVHSSLTSHLIERGLLPQ